MGGFFMTLIEQYDKNFEDKYFLWIYISIMKVDSTRIKRVKLLKIIMKGVDHKVLSSSKKVILQRKRKKKIINLKTSTCQ